MCEDLCIFVHRILKYELMNLKKLFFTVLIAGGKIYGSKTEDHVVFYYRRPALVSERKLLLV